MNRRFSYRLFWFAALLLHLPQLGAADLPDNAIFIKLIKPDGSCFPCKPFPVTFDGNKVIIPESGLPRGYQICSAEGLAIVIKDGKYGYFNPSYEIEIEPIYDACYDFSEGIAVIVDILDDDTRKYGYLRRDGSILAEPQYDWAYAWAGGYGCVKAGEKWGFIRPDGRWLIEPTYDYAYQMTDGRAQVILDGLEGTVGIHGKFSEDGYEFEWGKGWIKK